MVQLQDFLRHIYPFRARYSLLYVSTAEVYLTYSGDVYINSSLEPATSTVRRRQIRVPVGNQQAPSSPHFHPSVPALSHEHRWRSWMRVQSRRS